MFGKLHTLTIGKLLKGIQGNVLTKRGGGCKGRKKEPENISDITRGMGYRRILRKIYNSI